MIIPRDQYVNALFSKRWNGKVKIVTGIRRCGKSFLLSALYKKRLMDGKRKQSQYEIDFIVNTGKEKIYIQSALNIDTEEKRNQETFSLRNTGDFFKKIVILNGNVKPWTDDDGIRYIGIIPFLLDMEPLF